MRDVIREHFDLEERLDDNQKRFFVRESLRRVYTRPTAAEVAALQEEAEGCYRQGQIARAVPLASLLAKVKSALDDRERRKLDPDLEALARLQRAYAPAGPAAYVDPASLAAVQGAILAGNCLEFEYVREEGGQPQWRRVIPYGLVHSAVTYLVGKMPGRNEPPVYFRLDRMIDVRGSNTAGCAPEDWDLDAWMADSFGLWRDSAHDVILRVLPHGVRRARSWRFHPSQTFEEANDGTFLVRFHAGGLRELAEHLFTWAGEIVIEEPEALRAVMAERLASAERAIRPELASQDIVAGE